MSSSASFLEEVSGDYTLKTLSSNALVTIDTGLPGTTLITGDLSVVGNVDFAGNAAIVSNAISSGTTSVSIPVASGNIDVKVNNVGLASFYNDGLTVVGNVTGNYILGNGAFLSGLADSYSNANVANYLPTYTGNLVSLQGDVTTTANVTGNYILGNGAFLSGLPESYSNANVANFLVSYTGNISAGNISVINQVSSNTVSASGNIAASYFLGNGSQLTGVIATDVGVLQSLSVVGNIDTGNLRTAGSVSAAGNVSAAGVTVAGSGGDITGANNISATSNIVGGNLLTSGIVSSTTTVIGNIVSAVSNVSGANIVGGNLYGVNLSLSGNATIDGRINGSEVRIGTDSGLTNQGSGAVAVGLNAGYQNQGQYAIAIGTNAGATNQANNSIVLNASGVSLNGNNANAFYVNPVRNDTANTGNIAFYNTSTKEVTYANTISTTGNITAGYFFGDGSGLANINPGNISGLIGNAIVLGTNTQGQLISNAVTLTTSTTVTNGLALLNQVLGKLVPPAPDSFPGGQTLSISSLSTYRMANIVQVDNTPGANKSVAAGTTITNVRRASSYSTNTISTVGPGDSGTIQAVFNGTGVGSVTLNPSASPSGNGTYGSNLVITNNYDYNTANSQIAAGFWYVFSAAISGTNAPAGWNELYIADSATGNTNTPSWYYDNSSPATPSFSSTSMVPGSTSLLYSSTIPHYTNSTVFNIGATVANISGNTYPTSNTLASGSAGGSFAAPATVNYNGSNIGSNILPSFATASFTTTATVTTGFGGSSTGPSISVNNSYSTGTLTLTSQLANTVLYKSGTSTAIDESNVVIGSTIGSGSGNAYRIVNPGTGNTPAYTGSEAQFNSQTSTLQTYDATVVGSGSQGVLKHDQTNYSTGYLPAGPNLSSGRSGTQYFTFKFVRTAVSKFDIKYTGTIAGMWVALPGSVIDSSSSANGWIDMSVAYAGSGYPGANAPGNGSNGCAVGGTVTLNSAVTNSSKTCTFGTVSSSSTATNEIYVRIALTSGQSVTALTLQTASN